jgi:uncharacterized membrane protein SpoIIM required for sporulation
MELQRFISERQPQWLRLSRLLDEVEDRPDREIGIGRVQEIVALYRQTCSDLNKARSYTANEAVLARLNALTGRGYRFVYRRQPRGLTREGVNRFFRHEVPSVFQRRRLAVLWAGAALLSGAVLGFGAVLASAQWAERLVPAQFFTHSPKERVERLEESEERIQGVQEAADFASHLYTHNIRVSFLAFSLGALSIVGGLWILFYNGVILGAVAASYLVDGVHVFFLAWVGPHGALEIPAIVFAGAAGLVAGRALLLPGEQSSAMSLRGVFPDVWRMMIATCCVLVVAGIIEGSFSQFTAKTIPYSLKIGVAATLFAALFVYLFGGRAGEKEAE